MSRWCRLKPSAHRHSPGQAEESRTIFTVRLFLLGSRLFYACFMIQLAFKMFFDKNDNLLSEFIHV